MGNATINQSNYLKKHNLGFFDGITFEQASDKIAQHKGADATIQKHSPYPNSKNVTSFSKGKDTNSIERQVCLKAAVEHINHVDMGMRTPENIISAAETFRKWLQDEEK